MVVDAANAIKMSDGKGNIFYFRYKIVFIGKLKLNCKNKSMGHLMYLKLKKKLLQVEQITNWQLFSLKMTDNFE